MKKTIKLFTKLVTIDSPSKEEHGMAIFLEKWLENHSFQVKKDQMGNILAFRAGIGSPMLFSAHMDTVEPGRNIVPVIKANKIISSGNTILGADNKSSMSCILVGVENYLKLIDTPRPIELLFTVREEIGGGLDNFPFTWIKSKSGIIFDLARPIGTIVTSSPYIYNFKIEFNGTSAHAGISNKGVSAIRPAADLVLNIKEGQFDNGRSTVNIGKLTAGDGDNVVPATAIISGEIRSHNEESFRNIINEIERKATGVAKKWKTKVTFSLNGYCAGYSYSKKDQVIENIVEALHSFDKNLKIILHQSFEVSDSNPAIKAGIKLVTLGDGVENPHTTDETVSIKTLHSLTAIVEMFLNQL